MIVNLITPSVAFTSNEPHTVPKYSLMRRGGLTAGALLGLAACPSGAEPKVDTIPPRTDTATSTSTTPPPIVNDKTPKNIYAGKLQAVGIIPADAQGPPTKLAWYDEWAATNETRTLNKDLTNDSTWVYDGVTTDQGGFQSKYTYALTTDSNGDLVGTKTVNGKITAIETITHDNIEGRPYILFTGKGGGKDTIAWSPNGSGGLDTFYKDKTTGNLVQREGGTLEGFTTTFDAIARRLKSGLEDLFGGRLAFTTKSEGKTVSGFIDNGLVVVGKTLKAIG